MVLQRAFESCSCLSLGSFAVGGYGVSLFFDGGNVHTAFDVAENPSMYPRYGFLSDFGSQDCEDDNDVDFLLRCHINLVQFYDWMYRHHELIPPTDTFVDPLGRHLDYRTVLHKVQACHECSMQCIAYGAIYGSEDEYDYPEQVMLRSDGQRHRLIDRINMMYFKAGEPWAEHIIQEFRRVTDEAGFDGIHLDQYGFPKFAYIEKVSPDNLFDAEEAFAPFIRQVRETLPDKILIFNAVNNWPIKKVADAPVDAVYIEVWNPYSSYFYLMKIIEEAKTFGHNKPVILAAYLKPFQKDQSYSDDVRQSTFELTNATILASGAYHLIVGEDGAILQDAYYCDYGKLPDRERVIRYCDFAVRYRDLLYDPALQSAGFSYCGEGNGDLYIEDFSVSCDARAGSIWVLVNKKPGMKVIHLINLLDQTDDIWNAAKVPTREIHDLGLVVYCEDVQRAYELSPDAQDPSMHPCAFEQITNYMGLSYRFAVQSLKTWTTVVLFEKSRG